MIMGKSGTPRVSVSITAYNHAPFIAKAIDSVLMQRTDFEFEILIGEDDSTDGTRDIVKSYANNHPDKIRLFLNNRQDVIFIDGRPTGVRNLVNNLKNAKGEFIALLDGDDYWLNPNKLQKQVDYLDMNLYCSMVFHPVLISQVSEGKTISELRNPINKEFYDLNELLIYLRFIHTSSVVMRNWIHEGIPDWFKKTPISDWSIYVIAANYGLIGSINETMSVYRMHDSGTHTSQTAYRRISDVVSTYQILQENLESKYEPSIQKAIIHQSDYALQKANQSLKKNDIHESKRLFLLALRLDPKLIFKLMNNNYKVLVVYMLVFILGQQAIRPIRYYRENHYRGN